MSEKKCRYCANIIPKDIEICPYCRKKQGIEKQGTNFLNIIGGVIGLGFLILLIVGLVMKHVYPLPSTSRLTSEPSTSRLTSEGRGIKVTHPSWDDDTCNTIAEKKISIGFTSEQVIAAWGSPYKINTTIGVYGKHEQWVMHDSINSNYLYFENGILTSAQQSRQKARR